MNPGETENFFAIDGLQPFDPIKAAGFNRNNALWLAEFCRLIYRQERDERADRPAAFRTRRQILEAHGWHEEAVVRTGDGVPQAALVTQADPAGAVLVFRGTLGLRDVLTDMRWLLQPWAGPGHVHQGFKEAHAALWPEVRRQLQAVRSPIFLAGHSLGGALATMSAALCRRDLPPIEIAALYTFGSPRVGDRLFGRALESVPHFRVVDGTDVIARLPPVIPNPLLPYFQHTGQLHHLVEGALKVHAPGDDPLAAPTSESGIRNWRSLLTGGRSASGKLPTLLTDHAPVNYVARLESAAR